MVHASPIGHPLKDRRPPAFPSPGAVVRAVGTLLTAALGTGVLVPHASGRAPVDSARTGADSLVGSWAGTLKLPGAELRVVFHLDRTQEGELAATMDSPDQGAYGIQGGSVTVTGDSVRIDVPAVGGTFRGRVDPGPPESVIRGVWAQSGMELELELSRATEEEVAPRPRPQEPEDPLPYLSEEVTFRNGEAGIELAGTLTRPEGRGPFPAVALISGSGPQDRNETVAGHRPFLVLADHLTRRGIAVLRYDDRGVAASGGDFAEATTRDFATDAAAAARWLAAREDVNGDAVGLVGHSEGGLVAPMASRLSPEVDYLVLLAAPGYPGEDILYMQAEAIARAEGVPESVVAGDRSTRERLFRTIRETDDRRDREDRIREILSSSLATLDSAQAAARGIPTEREALEAYVEAQVRQFSAPWFRFFLGHDPRRVLRELEVPVLALGGENDLQVPADTNLAAIRDALAEAPTDRFEVRELAGLNHLFQTSDTGRPSEYARIEETISPVALDAVADWVLHVAGKAESGAVPDDRGKAERLDELDGKDGPSHGIRLHEAMRLIPFLTDSFSVRDVLTHLKELLRPPGVPPGRGPPELEFGFAGASADGMDQPPAAGPSEPHPIPDHAPRGAHEMDRIRSW